MQQQVRHSGLELREGIFDNVPHIIIGKDKPPVKPPLPPQQAATYPQPRQPQPPKDLIDKLKSYALIFFTCLILGATGFLVAKILIGRFF